MTAKTRATRAGFTLVEMLMVIAIIAILASLLFVGISKVRGSAKKVQAANDIQQLDVAVGAAGFKRDFGIYPPSHITVASGVMRFQVPKFVPGTQGNSLAAQQNDASCALLQRMFPRWVPSDGGTGTNQITPALPLVGEYLDPNQCLVYFLGGPAALNPALGQPGWDVASPYMPAGNTRRGPYFDFPASRVAVPDPSIGYTSLNALPNFLDPWGVPYAYFAASGDNYDGRLFFPFGSTAADLTAASSQYSGTGSRAVRMGNKWMNPSKVQIVSAGPNRKFGPGSPSANAASPSYSAATDIRPGLSPGYSENDAGEDDIANFNEGSPLGTSSAP